MSAIRGFRQRQKGGSAMALRSSAYGSYAKQEGSNDSADSNDEPEIGAPLRLLLWSLAELVIWH